MGVSDRSFALTKKNFKYGNIYPTFISLQLI